MSAGDDPGASAYETALAQFTAGRLADAERLLTESLDAGARHAESMYLLGAVLRLRGRAEASATWLRRAVAADPATARYHVELALTLHALGELAPAAEACDRALALDPGLALAHCTLGLVREREGRPREALRCFAAAVARAPGNASYRYLLGNAELALGRDADALGSFDAVLAVEPRHMGAHNNRGLALERLADLDAAQACFERAMAVAPSSPVPVNNLGNVHKRRGELTEAAACYRGALQRDSAYQEAEYNLADVLRRQGFLGEARRTLARALGPEPVNAWAHSNLVFLSNYDETISLQESHAIHVAWAKRHARPLAATIRAHRNDPSPRRTLRVGYVSADFRMHPVGLFVEPLLEAHDRDAVTVLCYSDTPGRDEHNDRLRALADEWRDIAGDSDADVAARVREDEVDLLVDLSGHTDSNRLLVFARKPAPVQATWLGYFNTTGLDTMDWLIADEVVVPRDTGQRFTESVYRLPDCHWCYRAPRGVPEPAPPPALRRGHVTFGCFNNPAKITAPTIAAWCEILRRTPSARLVLKYGSLDDAATRERILERFAAERVDPSRLELRGASPHLRYFEEHADVDVALDPFPYSGGTVSCDALWMGVPVITLAGDRLASRLTTTILSHLGLPELIAPSTDGYVAAAARIAGDTARLESLRHGLRARFTSSALGDPARFAAQMESAYRAMWSRWCASR